MKLITDIYCASGYCWEGVRGQRSRS